MKIIDYKEKTMLTQTSYSLQDRIADIVSRKKIGDPKHFLSILTEVNMVLQHEEIEIRPKDIYGHPGGIVYLDNTLDTIIIPDVHARLELIPSVLKYRPDGRDSVFERLKEHNIQIVFVGDAMHAESRALDRWKKAKDEYIGKYRRHTMMDEEMKESLGVMEIILELKHSFPELVHYLKGNHDNITNERKGGNFPFIKLALEGPMVTEYVRKFLGVNFLDQYYAFEKNLPLLAVGDKFLVSHAEPARYFNYLELVNYRYFPDVVSGLTWTDDDASRPGSVELMLEEYTEKSSQQHSFYFGGHRPVRGLYNLRAHGRYVQLHNPGRLIFACIRSDKPVVLERDIILLNQDLYRGKLS